jgi:hypothetical protein
MDFRLAVSLLVFTKNEQDELVVVLQKRGPYDYEEGELQSFAGAYQISCHGGIESPQEALYRECQEELGEEFFAELPPDQIIELEPSDPQLAAYLDGKKLILNSAIFVPLDLVKKIVLQPSSDENLTLLREEEIDSIQPLTKEERSGVQGEGIKMFPDAIKTLRLGFAEMKKKLALNQE